MDMDLSTRGQISPSIMLNRGVSTLVENQDMQQFESRGSFLSFENSNSSEYKGVLLGLCRSAKMVSIPTSKRLERNSKGIYQ